MSKENRYIIGVSGGSDSMALLHMLTKEGNNLIVAHVNYQKRATAQRDQELVEHFCRKHNLIFELCIADDYQEGNFQNWAREKRYQFFRELAEKYQAQGVFIAHQLDDLLETYLMQQKRKSIPFYWGLKKEVEIDGLGIIRPLLQYEKKELVEYCIEHHIEYGEDESNATDAYERNRIRHTKIDSMDKVEKLELLKEIEEKNELLKKQQEEIEQAITTLQPVNLEAYQNYPEVIRLEALRKWFLKNQIDSRHFSSKHLLEIDKLLLKGDNVEYPLKEGYIFFISYQEIGISKKEEISYQYFISQGEYLDTPYFKVTSSGNSFESVTVSEEEYPLMIRNWKPGDSIQMRYGTKKIKRWFIDHKISVFERQKWPVVLNKQGEIILVPGIGCNITHFSNNPSLFVIK